MGKTVHCEVCGREYANTRTLNVHRRTKHDLYKLKPCRHFECPLCGDVLVGNFFARHLVNRHGIPRGSKKFFVTFMAHANHYVNHIEDKDMLEDLFSRIYDKYGSKSRPGSRSRRTMR